MADNLTRGERELLLLIAEYRMLLTRQLARLQQWSMRTTRRNIADLEARGLIQVSPYTGGSGRPEKLLALTPEAVEALRVSGGIDPKLPADGLTGQSVPCVNHQLLLNWFRIHLLEMERRWPKFAIHFLASTSPFPPRKPTGQPLIDEQTDNRNARHGSTGFLPDAVFSITHKIRNMTLLFFLEVDMGTEPLTCSDPHGRDIRGKILNYQDCFRQSRYKRYEPVFSAPLGGFRVLFLTNSAARWRSLCRLVREMPPTDFIWLTHDARMHQDGVDAPIWARGGRDETELESILGTERSGAPAPAVDHQAPVPP